MVDGVAAVAYGTPESAAAIRAASEGTAGVRGGGRGGGGTGAASFAVGEQLQNMLVVLGVLGGPWGTSLYGVRGGDAAQRWVQVRGEMGGEVIPPLRSQRCGQLSAETRVVRIGAGIPSVLHAASCERSAAASIRPRAAQSSSACCCRYVRKPPCRNQECYGARPPVRANSSAAPS